MLGTCSLNPAKSSCSEVDFCRISCGLLQSLDASIFPSLVDGWMDGWLGVLSSKFLIGFLDFLGSYHN